MKNNALFSHINLRTNTIDTTNNPKWEKRQSPIYVQFTGTLYNHDTLAQTLSSEPLVETTMLLILAYEKWGINLVQYLDGIFALAIYDTQKSTLFLAKDKVSIYPLYYYHDDDSFAFSSSLKALVAQTFAKKEINKQALANYFTYGYILQPNTIYRHSYKIKSGHLTRLNLQTHQLSHEKYWDLGACYDTPKLSISEADFQDEAQRLLKASIQKRSQGLTHYAASLSGGYDSSTIAALLQENSHKPIQTFTIGFEDASINEAPDAKKIAQHLGTEHQEYYFTAKDALDIVPKLSQIYDEPFYDNGSIPTNILTRLAEESGIETIFAGDGGDEVFATADDVGRFERILSLPNIAKKSAYTLLNTINPSQLPYLKDHNNFSTKYYKFIHILNAQSIPEMVKYKMTLFHPTEIKHLLCDDNVNFKSIFDSLYFGPHAQGVDKVIGSYFKTFMTDGELVKTTQAFKQHNIGIREPYLDHDLIAFMAQVPEEIKIKHGIKKHLLKQIAHQYIPKALLDRPKKGFSVPFAQWMRGELHALLMATLNEENLKKDGILDPDYVIHIRNSFLSGKEEYKYKLWSILLYQLWYQHNIRT